MPPLLDGFRTFQRVVLTNESLPSSVVITASVRHHLEEKEESLSPYASRSGRSQGRERFEEPSPLRTEFQRDRDRIIHSKAFRRLKHKTQVFIAPLGDHFVTRLTHTLEVAQIARTIARALELNEDLAEAISLGHDLGHTPFGHIGEDELNTLNPAGFRHSAQSLRIVKQLEKDGQGLNLTWEVRQGIVSHSKPRGDFLGRDDTAVLTLEGQTCRIADAVAYLNHDLVDAFRAGVLTPNDLPSEVIDVLGSRHSERIDAMVSDIVESSWAATGRNGTDLQGRPVITMSPRVRQAVNTLREYMFRNVYEPEDDGEEGQAARRIVRLLYQHLSDHPDEVPIEYDMRSGSGHDAGVDYLSGMTDRYALRLAEKIRPGVAEIFRSKLL